MNINHIPTEAEKLIDRIFVAMTNEEACAEAIVAEVGELLSGYRKGREMNTRRIDTMSRERIVAELVRIAAYCSETYRLNGEAAGKPNKTAIGSRQQGEAIGRRQICACIADDIAETFGITTTNNESEVAK